MLFLTSCSNEESIVENTNQLIFEKLGKEYVKSSKSKLIPAEDVLVSIWKNDANGENFLLVATDVNDNDLHYLAEYDYSTGQIFVYDHILDEEFRFDFDTEFFAKISDDQMLEEILNSNFEKSDRVKFWGWTCGPTFSLEIDGSNEMRTCCYRIMGLKNHCDQYSAGDLPGRNPTIQDQ